MSYAARNKDPAFVNEVMSLIETGATPEEVVKIMQNKLTISDEVSEEVFPEEIKLISQALAFREPGPTDFEEIYKVLSSAYSAELKGDEAFRKGENLNKENMLALYQDEGYSWYVVEAPNGKDVVEDGAILGACCFSTDGVSRRNGEVEGKLGSIRFFGVLPVFHGVCIGLRLLQRVESLMFKKGCCRSMACIPSARKSMIRWITHRGYREVGNVAYPKGLGHDLVTEVTLSMFVKPLESLDGTSRTADDKIASELSLASKEPSDDTIPENQTQSNTDQPKRRMLLSPIWRPECYPQQPPIAEDK